RTAAEQFDVGIVAELEVDAFDERLFDVDVLVPDQLHQRISACVGRVRRAFGYQGAEERILVFVAAAGDLGQPDLTDGSVDIDLEPVERRLEARQELRPEYDAGREGIGLLGANVRIAAGERRHLITCAAGEVRIPDRVAGVDVG